GGRAQPASEGVDDPLADGGEPATARRRGCCSGAGGVASRAFSRSSAAPPLRSVTRPHSVPVTAIAVSRLTIDPCVTCATAATVARSTVSAAEASHSSGAARDRTERASRPTGDPPHQRDMHLAHGGRRERLRGLPAFYALFT